MSRKQNTNTLISYSHVSKSVDHPSNIYRNMIFVPQPVYESTVTNYSGIPELEDYNYLSHQRHVRQRTTKNLYTEPKQFVTSSYRVGERYPIPT